MAWGCHWVILRSTVRPNKVPPPRCYHNSLRRPGPLHRTRNNPFHNRFHSRRNPQSAEQAAHWRHMSRGMGRRRAASATNYDRSHNSVQPIYPVQQFSSCSCSLDKVSTIVRLHSHPQNFTTPQKMCKRNMMIIFNNTRPTTVFGRCMRQGGIQIGMQKNHLPPFIPIIHSVVFAIFY